MAALVNPQRNATKDKGSKLALNSYKRLVSDIAELYEGARRALVEAYWKIGQRIVEVEQQGEIKAAYDTGLLLRLSEDLTQKCGPGFSDSNLRRMRQFYLTYPKRAAPHELTWAQYAELLPVGDVRTRERLEKRALEEGLTHKALRALVRHEMVREQVAENLAASPETREPPELLEVPKLGLLNTYQIKDPNDTSWPEKKGLLLDHGFKGYRTLTPQESRGPNTNQSKRSGDWGRPNYRYGKEIKSLGGLKAGDIVKWTGTKLLKTNRTAKDLFTYKSYLEKVIDGDTLWVVLDIGMREVSRQKLRLRGIDCPEIDTKEGQEAKKFVESVLRNVPYLTVLSSQNASYDRYEADVFFNDKEGQQTYLNNLLLEKGYAVRVRE